MTWVAIAVGAGTAIVGAGASVASAKKGAKAQTKASNDAIGFERESRDLALKQQKPFQDASYAATAALMDLTGLDRGTPKKALSYDEWAAQQPASETTVQKKKKHGLFGGGLIGGLLAPTLGDMVKGSYDPAGAVLSGAKGHSAGTMANPALQADYQAYLKDFNDTPDIASYAHYDYKTDPGYAFRLSEGEKGLDRSAAARGGLLSGAAVKGAERYGQDYASNEYQKVYDRIATIAGFGPAAANSSTNVITNTGANIGSALINAGEARASSYVAQGNAWSNALNQAGMYAGYKLGGLRQPPLGAGGSYNFPG